MSLNAQDSHDEAEGNGGRPRRNGGGRRLRRRWLIAAMVLLLPFALLGGTALEIWRYGHVRYSGKADAALVLGAAAWHTRPSPVYEERLRHAVDLFHAGRVSQLVLTGGFGPGAAFTEAEVGARYAQRQGVPSQALLLENASRSTAENFTFARPLLRQQEIRSVIVVSDPLHMKRAMLMARRSGLKAHPSPTPSSRYRTASSQLNFLLRETFFYLQYLMLGEA